MSGGEVPSSDHPQPVPPDVAERLVRALDRSPTTVVTLMDADLKVRWLSHSSTWVTGTDPSGRAGADSLERIHPDDVERLLHGIGLLRAATPAESPTVPVAGPVRYRFQRFDGRWVVMEAVVHNLLGDPVVNGLLVESRPVEDGLDGVGNVVDLLVADAPLPDVLAACAGLVPIFLGSTAIVAFVDGGPVIGAAAGSAAQRFAADDRWWRRAAAHDEPWTPADLAGVPDDLAEAARAEGFTAAWVLPLTDETSGEVMGCIVIWAQVTVEYNIAIDEGLRQARRLASLVIGEERRRHALRRLAATDPLTGLSNRSALRRRLDGAAGPVTLALVDLDDFKPVNDTLGHDAGDLVLQVVAERLTETVRADDLVVRFGGDEFAVVFADGTSPESAGLLAQRIVDAIGAPVGLDGAPQLTVGASVGLATADADKVVRRADEALYAAKRAKHGPVASDGPDARRHHPTPRP